MAERIEFALHNIVLCRGRVPFAFHHTETLLHSLPFDGGVQFVGHRTFHRRGFKAIQHSEDPVTHREQRRGRHIADDEDHLAGPGHPC